VCDRFGKVRERKGVMKETQQTSLPSTTVHTNDYTALTKSLLHSTSTVLRFLFSVFWGYNTDMRI